MAWTETHYSKIIGWLKILLPLLALGILSTLFLWSRTIDPTRAIPFSQVDVDALIREPRITEPDYTSVTEDGTALHFSAESARPDPATPGRASAIGLVGLIKTPDGIETSLSSRSGDVDPGAETITLQGDVIITSSLGYEMRTEDLKVMTDRTRLETGGNVTTNGPFGKISSGHMLLTRAGDQSGPYVLIFNQGVKLIYDPQE